MSQTRLGSFIEAIFNVLIGAGVGLTSQLIVFPMFGINIPLSDNIAIMCWFTAISVARSYIVRRWFNSMIVRAVERMGA